MSFVDIKGSTSLLDPVLQACLRSGLFHPEYAAKLSEYSVGSAALLRNPYAQLLGKVTDAAAQLKLELVYTEPEPEGLPKNTEAYLEESRQNLRALRAEYTGSFERLSRLQGELATYHAAAEALTHMQTLDVTFDQLWKNKFLQLRFGYLPSISLSRLQEGKHPRYYLVPLEDSRDTAWCLYLTSDEFAGDTDKQFADLGFHRLRLPELHGTAQDAAAWLRQAIKEERRGLEEVRREIDGVIAREQARLMELYSILRFLHDCYDLRKYAVSIRGQFHVVGFLPTRGKEEFLARFEAWPEIAILCDPAQEDFRIPPPVKLKNGWFSKPFEMFVNMYGSPAYGDIDPTPFVAVTYSLLFGMMFGDVGHGLCAVLAGLVMWKWKGANLGRIISRAGACAMVFGFLYGSVFGFEHLLDPVFRAMGFAEKPLDVMHPETTNMILVAAVAIGAFTIMMVIVYNMLTGIRRRDWERTLLSHNGLCGLTFYAAVLYGGVMTLLGNQVFHLPYVLLLIVLPLLLIFFREPIARFGRLMNKDAIIHREKELEESTKFQEDARDIPQLFASHFLAARFGRIPTDSYRKLSFYEDEPFLIHPLKTDQDYIWLIYATATPNKEEIDAIFQDLYFERIYIPDEDMASGETAIAFVKKCVEAGGTPEEVKPHEKYGAVKITKRKTVYNHLFPEGFGGFFTETFFEMFEVLLSFVSNTMSFLRVGAFVLIHAGMMSVVFTLAEMMSGAGSVAVLIGGNLFVMCLEGLIVGIQVLRLEFYEMFSRFYDAGGESYRPVRIRTGSESVS